MLRAMKHSVWPLALSAVVLAAAIPSTTLADPPVTRRGTSVMHYLVRGELRSTNDPSAVLGSFRLQSNEQGRSAKEMLDLRLDGLEPNATFDLLAVSGDETNAPVVVGSLTSDGEGDARVSYRSNGQGRGRNNALPEGLSPLTSLRALGVENAATQVVAHVWIADASKYQYLVKRNLTPENPEGTAAGQISLIANEHKVKFRLLAGGLGATNDYHLALNGEIHATIQSSESGRVEIKEWPGDAPGVLDLRSLALWDSASNVVLRTSLPR